MKKTNAPNKSRKDSARLRGCKCPERSARKAFAAKLQHTTALMSSPAQSQKEFLLLFTGRPSGTTPRGLAVFADVPETASVSSACCPALGSDLDARAKVNLSPRLPWDDRTPRRGRRLKAVGPHAAKMQLHCALDPPQGGVDGLARGHTARQVWN